jgi:hypothetical protein
MANLENNKSENNKPISEKVGEKMEKMEGILSMWMFWKN